MDLKEVVRRLETFAPKKLAGTWDNVGLLVQPPSLKKVSKIMLTNDLTEAVLDEAVDEGVNLILSYHPPVFKPLKRITMCHWKERIVAKCIEKKIAVYSPHTAHDAVQGGVNDWLVGAFGEAIVTPLEQTFEALRQPYEIRFVDKLSYPEVSHLIEGLQGHDDCDMRIEENTCNIFFSENKLLHCVSILSLHETLSSKRYTIVKREKVPKLGYGMGRTAVLKNLTTIGDVVAKLKAMTNLSHVRLAFAPNHTLSTVVRLGAVCAGAGVSVLRGVNADLLVTGEMSHHDLLEATQCGSSVILLEHSNSERGYLSQMLEPKLKELFDHKLDVFVSRKDRDPLLLV